jgi:hypothetical protein
VLGLVNGWGARSGLVVFALAVGSACSSSGSGDDDSAGGQGGGGTGGGAGTGGSSGNASAGKGGPGAGAPGSGGASAGAPGTGGMAGTAKGGASGSAGTSTGPASCTALTREPAVSPFYTPPDPMLSWFVAGTFDGGQGAIIALNVDRSVRLVGIGADGTATELLNEMEYKRGWPFDPTELVAYRTSDGIELLVTDNANLALVSKHGSVVTSVGLADTSYMDLHVVGFVPTASGVLAVYFKGDPMNATPATLSAYDPTTQETATRTLQNDATPVITTHDKGAWLTTERLDLASDCQDSGDVVKCGGGEPDEPAYDCTWHLDVWSATDASFMTAEPLATLDAPANLSRRCGDDMPAGLSTYLYTMGDGIGFGGHHATAVDEKTGALAIAIQQSLGAGSPGVKFVMLDGTGQRLIDGTLAPLNGINESSWMAVLGGNPFICGSDECAMSVNGAGMGFRFPYSSDALSFPDAALHRPNGLGLLGGINGNPIWLELVDCMP